MSDDICVKCNRSLNDEYTEFFDKNFHPKCFNCEQCGINLMRKPFKAIGKIPYCNQCVENTPQLYQKFKKQKFDNSGRVYAKKGKPPKKAKAKAAPAGATSGTNTVVTTTTTTSKQKTTTPPPKNNENKAKEQDKNKEEEEPIENKKVTKTTFVFCCTIS